MERAPSKLTWYLKYPLLFLIFNSSCLFFSCILWLFIWSSESSLISIWVKKTRMCIMDVLHLISFIYILVFSWTDHKALYTVRIMLTTESYLEGSFLLSLERHSGKYNLDLSTRVVKASGFASIPTWAFTLLASKSILGNLGIVDCGYTLWFLLFLLLFPVGILISPYKMDRTCYIQFKSLKLKCPEKLFYRRNLL